MPPSGSLPAALSLQTLKLTPLTKHSLASAIHLADPTVLCRAKPPCGNSCWKRGQRRPLPRGARRADAHGRAALTRSS